MKNNINAALAAKAEKILNTKMRYEEGVMTRREWLNMWRIKGAAVEESTKNRIQFNRLKFNRMKGGIWGNEQSEYEKKCNEMIPCYNLRIPNERSFFEITKTEYEYFKNMALAEDLATEKSLLTEDELMAKEFEFAEKYF